MKGRQEERSAARQGWFWTDRLTTETLQERSTKPVEKSPRITVERDRRSRWKPSYQVLNSWINMWPCEVNGGHLAHTQAPSFITRQWSLFLDCLHTHTLKTKTAGLKMGPCHSLLGVNLLCPQSCSPLSHCSPFHRVLITHWILVLCLTYGKICPLPSTTRQPNNR